MLLVGIMEQAYFDRLREMKRFCLSEIILLPCIAVLCVIGGISFFEKQFVWEIFSVAGIAAAVLWLVLYNKRMHRSITVAPYSLKTDIPLTKESVIETLCNQPTVQRVKKYSEDETALFLRNGLRVRLLIIYIPEFTKEAFDCTKKRINRKINNDFRAKHTVSKNEAVKRVRVNLILTDAVNAELDAFLYRNAADTMRRVEGILNVAVDLTQSKIFIPAMFGDCIFSDIRKYERCVKSICKLTNNPYKYNTKR